VCEANFYYMRGMKSNPPNPPYRLNANYSNPPNPLVIPLIPLGAELALWGHGRLGEV